MNLKLQVAQHLQKKQISNQIQLLQQQLNKSQEQQAAAEQLLNNQVEIHQTLISSNINPIVKELLNLKFLASPTYDFRIKTR